MNRKTWSVFASYLAVVAATTAARAQDAGEMPGMTQPTEQHKMLEQFAGEWTCTSDCVMPGQSEPIHIEGKETCRMIGGLWMVASGKSEVGGEGGESLITVGYDVKKQSYVGTFVCSGQDNMWQYKGRFDDTGKKLILETSGPSMTEPGKTANYQEVLTTVDADHKTFTSSIQGPDGQWTQLIEVKYERAK